MTRRKIEYWVIPPQADAEFAANMEQVLDLYQKPYDPDCPVVCMDEQPVQLVRETRPPMAATKQRPRRVDYEYERAGTASVFLFSEPLAGWRQATARARRRIRCSPMNNWVCPVGSRRTEWRSQAVWKDAYCRLARLYHLLPAVRQPQRAGRARRPAARRLSTPSQVQGEVVEPAARHTRLARRIEVLATRRNTGVAASNASRAPRTRCRCP